MPAELKPVALVSGILVTEAFIVLASVVAANFPELSSVTLFKVKPLFLTKYI